jgi:ATP-binding cassette subfamily F protein 3
MAIITVSNISKSFGPRELLRDVSFFINERERVALIGANGSGKTTLLRIICGEQPADSGSVAREPGATVGYLPQEADLPPAATLSLAVMGVTPQLLACATEMSELEQRMATASSDDAVELGHRYADVSHSFDTLHGFDYEIRTKAILLGLGFDESELGKSVRNLSGGQKIRAALARLLLLSPDLLLLDEPTNHLDIQACEWLQTFLREKYNGAALIVSHDRFFMDQVAGKVIEIEGRTVDTYAGNYSAYAQQKAAKIEEQRKIYKSQQKEISRIEAAIQTLYSDRKFSRRDNKIKQLERIERVGPLRENRTIKANLSPGARSGREVLRLSGLTKGYPGKDLFRDMDFVVERGRKLGIVGPNGSGKTTLLRIIAGRETADAGLATPGHNVEPVYFAQEFDHLVPTRTTLEELLADADLTSGQARDLLAQFLFMGDDAFKKVEVLSGGEMCRLALAKTLAKSPNFLLLDEPTNHLDIRSREALEEALRAFHGTALIASHDRYLLDAVADGIIEIKDGGWTFYLGNYSAYREKTLPEPVPDQTIRTMSPKGQDQPKKRPDSPLRARQRLFKQLDKRRGELENEIERIEERLAELTAALGDEENYRNATAGALSGEYNAQSEKLETVYADWEQTCEQIAEVDLEQ